MVNDHKVIDYDIQLNDVIQLMTKVLPTDSHYEVDKSEEDNIQLDPKTLKEVDTFSKYYKLGDLIDVRLLDTGAWCEAKIIKIFKQDQPKIEVTVEEESDLFFRVKR